MTWWLRSRLDPLGAALVLGGAVLMPWLASTEMPAIRLRVGVVPFAVFLPGVVATGLVAGLARGHRVAEARSRRPLGWADAGLVLGAAGAVVLAWALSALAGAGASGLVMGARNLAGYLGVGLMAHRLIGGAGALATPLAYAGAVSAIASVDDGLLGWAVHPARSPGAAVVAVGLLAAGGCVAFSRAARTAHALRWAVEEE